MAPKKQSKLDPSLPASRPTTSRNRYLESSIIEKQPSPSFRQRCCTYLYNRQEGTYCGRTCLSWFLIIAYSIVYLLFLCTYMLSFLISGLWIIRSTGQFDPIISPLVYSGFRVGISATPTSEFGQPLIWYRGDHPEDYQKYVKSMDNLLSRRKRAASDLGPCGQSPYGYGDKPCVILRVNKHLKWAGKPLLANSTEAETAPIEVRNWMKRDKKLWLHCEGYHSYDKEHLGRIRYFPDPPGFDPSLFPAAGSESPLIAIQISGFSFGVSLAIECKLWYENGPSTVEFILYVSDDSTVSNRTNV